MTEGPDLLEWEERSLNSQHVCLRQLAPCACRKEINGKKCVVTLTKSKVREAASAPSHLQLCNT